MRKKIALFLVALVAGSIGSVATATPAHAAVRSGYTYLIQLENTPYCMALPGYPYGAGEQLMLENCAFAPSFTFFDTGVSSYEYWVRVDYSGYYVQAGAPSLKNSTLIQWPFCYCSDQVWHLNGGSNGIVLIQIPAHNWWLMRAEYASLYSYIRQNDASSGPYQLFRWWLVPV